MAIALGVFVDDKFRVAGTMTQVLLFAMIFGLTMINDMYNRLAIFHATGLLMGINIGTLVNSVMHHRCGSDPTSSAKVAIKVKISACRVFQLLTRVEHENTRRVPRASRWRGPYDISATALLNFWPSLDRPDIVMTALMGTCTIFVCFSAASMLAKRREFLYLGGMLSSAISMLFMARWLIYPLAHACANAPTFSPFIPVVAQPKLMAPISPKTTFDSQNKEREL